MNKPGKHSAKQGNQINASRITTPWPVLQWCPLLDGVLLTYGVPAPTERGIIGQVQPWRPLGSMFLPGVYVLEAEDSAGIAGVWAIRHGVTADELGLKPLGAQQHPGSES